MIGKHVRLPGLVLACLLLGAAAPVPVAERFAQPDQTVEYHFMIQADSLQEAGLAGAYGARVVAPLGTVAELGPLGKWKPCIYVDSRQRDLKQHHLIVRVRNGRIDVKARAASPAALVDLGECASRKYEMDYFGTPDYSISSEIEFDAEELDVRHPAWPISKLWDCVERNCPGLGRQLRTEVPSLGAAVIPGVAHMYGAPAVLKHPSGSRVKEASVAVWFFPPTDRFLVELSFTGYVRDRADMDRMYADLSARLAAAGLLRADQSSKTEQYFQAYFAPAK
jgi:hypothetical protein